MSPISTAWVTSGSPVFEPNVWKVVALHQAGNSVMQRLDDRSKTYEANEGISVLTIKQLTKPE